MTDDDLRYQEALRRYQVEVAQYETAVREYKKQLSSLKESEAKPSRPIPPIPPMKALKFTFGENETAPDTGFNEGIESAAQSLEAVNERELAAWVRKQKR